MKGQGTHSVPAGLSSEIIKVRSASKGCVFSGLLGLLGGLCGVGGNTGSVWFVA